MHPFLNTFWRYAIALFILISLSNCYKEKQPENLGLINAGEAKDYLLFKPGTWWVYKNTWTNELDTMVLTYCSLDTSHAESNLRVYDYENIEFYIKSLRDQAIYHTYGQAMSPEGANFTPGWVWECWRVDGMSLQFNINQTGNLSGRFYYPFDKEQKRSNGVYLTKFNERINSILINGQTYMDIVSFSVERDLSVPYPNKFILNGGNSKYYWSKHIGMVKIEHESWDQANNGNLIKMNWELIQSHIIP